MANIMTVRWVFIAIASLMRCGSATLLRVSNQRGQAWLTGRRCQGVEGGRPVGVIPAATGAERFVAYHGDDGDPSTYIIIAWNMPADATSVVRRPQRIKNPRGARP